MALREKNGTVSYRIHLSVHQPREDYVALFLKAPALRQLYEVGNQWIHQEIGSAKGHNPVC